MARRKLSGRVHSEKPSRGLSSATIHYHYGDVLDPFCLLEILRTANPDEIYHLAAQSHVGLSFSTSTYTSDVDALGTLRVLESIIALGLEKKVWFYNACSSEVFGDVKEQVQNENTPFNPRSSYAVAKLYSYYTTVNFRDQGVFAVNEILFNHESPRRATASTIIQAAWALLVGIYTEQYGLQKIQHLNEDARAACNFQSLLVVQAALEPRGGDHILQMANSFLSVDCALMLECEIHDRNTVFRATFDDQVLSDVQITRMLYQLEHLVQRLPSGSPWIQVKELQGINDNDIAQILEWNSADNAGTEVISTVHELIGQMVIDAPSAAAISSWDGQLSYGLLNVYSSRLATYLQHECGVRNGSLVAICFEKSMWVVVSMLAVLKAGGACVPMDPKSPSGRLQTLLDGLGNDSAGLIMTSTLHAKGMGKPRSIGDIFATLIHGGCVCIPSEHDMMNNLGGAIRSLRANQVSLTTSLASHLRPEEVPELKTLIIAGEAISKDIIEAWADHVSLINTYGPAECTVYCTGKANIERCDHPSNIGRGVGAIIWLTDPEEPNRLAPIGAVGEILIEGPRVARGYLGNVAQTKSAFLRDLAWSKRQDPALRRRFYRTGDLGSYNHDGAIAFIGRNDDQVKIYGQRLEIGEVEHQLRVSLPSTVQVAVSVVVPKHAGKALGAFIVLGDDDDNRDESLLCTSSRSLEQFRHLMEGLVARLGNVLPSYMIPQVYIPIRSLPLSASGKVDRKRLQNVASNYSFEQLSALHGLEAQIPRHPSTTMEKLLRALWKELLKIEEISLEGNFFRLGGDSVLSMQLVSISCARGVTFTVQNIFWNASLRGLAATAREDTQTAELAPIPANQIEDIYPSTFLQRRMIIGQKRASSEPRDYQAQLVFALPGSLDVEQFQAAWNSASRRHSILRTRLIRYSAEIFQVVVKDNITWAEAVSLEAFLHQDRFDNMTFGKALGRFAIVQEEGNNERNFVLTNQHAIYDAFSLSLLFSEVEKTYLGTAPSISMPPQMNSYIKYLVEADRHAAVGFWSSYLAGTDTKPLHRPGEPFPKITIRTVVFDIPIVRDRDLTLSTIIETATGLALAHHIGCTDVILCSVRLGRSGSVARLEELVGPTNTVVPLRALQGKMLQHEHLGFFELKEMEDLSPVLQHSYHVNVDPAPTSVLGTGLGMRLHQTQMRNADPLRVYVDLNAGRLELNIRSDDDYVPEVKVKEILADIRNVISRFVRMFPGEGTTVGEIFGE
ncbi:NRPS protein [Seiridium cupressi]